MSTPDHSNTEELPPLIYEKDGAIAKIVLNRPASRNALTPQMLCLFADAMLDFEADVNLHVMILTGAGERAFCAGGDLATTLPLMTGARLPVDEWDHRVLDDKVVMAASSLRDYPIYKPVISAINGACFAGGFEIMLGTDIRIAAEHAQFALPEVRRALIPFAGSMVRLPHQISYCKAMEILLTGDAISASEAAQAGLVNYVLPANEVMPKAMEIAERISKNGPVAIRQIKQTVLKAIGVSLEEAYKLEDASKRIVMASEDAKEGPLAFMEKRDPIYRNR